MLNFGRIISIILTVLIIQFCISYFSSEYVKLVESELVNDIFFLLIKTSGFLIYSSALVYLFDGILTGVFLSSKNCIRKSIASFPILFVTFIPIALGISFGPPLLMMPGLFFAARFSFAFFDMLLNSENPYFAAKKSYRLTSGYTFQLIFCIILIGFPTVFFKWISQGLIINHAMSLEAIEPKLLFYLAFRMIDVVFAVATSYLLILLFRIFCLVNEAQNNIYLKKT